jgi:hypothetical protein
MSGMTSSPLRKGRQKIGIRFGRKGQFRIFPSAVNRRTIAPFTEGLGDSTDHSEITPVAWYFIFFGRVMFIIVEFDDIMVA